MGTSTARMRAWRQDNPEKFAEATDRMNEARRNYRKRIQAVKLDSGCIDCGYSEHPEALQFDHRPDEEKSFTISRNLGVTWERMTAEIAKCDIRCANCHAVKTAERRVML